MTTKLKRRRPPDDWLAEHSNEWQSSGELRVKLKRLIDKIEKFVSYSEKGKDINSEKLLKLQQLLADKKLRYEAKLANNQDSEKQSKLQARLRVVNAQLEKSKNL